MLNNEIFKKVVIYLLFIILGCVFTIVFFKMSEYYEYQEKIKLENKVIEQQKKEKIKQENFKKQRENIISEIITNTPIKAKSFLVKNLDTKEIIFEKNSQRMFGLASLTKIATAIVALESENENIKIQPHFLKILGESGLVSGEVFKKKDLTELMFMESVNDGSTALAYSGTINRNNHENFLKKMNKLAVRLNMNSTIFFSDSGLDITSSVNGSYGSAQDVSKLIYFIYKNHPTFVKNTTVPRKVICSNIFCHDVENTNPLVEITPNIIFSKTGWTREAQGNLALIYEFNNEIFSIIILHSTKGGRFEDAKNLIKAIELYHKKMDSI